MSISKGGSGTNGGGTFLRHWATTGWLAVILLAQAGAVAAAEPESLPDAKALVSGVVQNQRTTGSRARAKLSIEPAQGPTRSLQVLIKGRREGATNETLVVVMWPREEKGRAWMIRRTDAGEVSVVPTGSTAPGSHHANT